MEIRNSIKAIIIRGTKLLVAKMKAPDGTIYYTLPGGKQESDELMIEALKREVREETGFEVEPKSLLFIREGFTEENHRIEFMFVCDITGTADESTQEYDFNQIGVHWLSIDNILHEQIYPIDMRNVIKQYFLGKSSPIYLGEMR